MILMAGMILAFFGLAMALDLPFLGDDDSIRNLSRPLAASLGMVLLAVDVLSPVFAASSRYEWSIIWSFARCFPFAIGEYPFYFARLVFGEKWKRLCGKILGRRWPSGR